ncbi:MAG: ABC transporter substrate-binding protein [Ignavibacteria bacterium]|jgi:phospholipid/cholesterol/gamma-HCH transport system substrate-binding protein
MRDSRKTEIKVGITVIVALVVFIWVFGWAKNFSIHTDVKTIFISFDNIAGLEIGDRIFVDGRKRGFVEEFGEENNKVIVKGILEQDVKLHEDAEFSILMLDLMGGKKIEIYSGKSCVELDYRKVHEGKFRGDVSTALAMISSVQNDLVSVIKEVRVSLCNINEFLDDSDFKNDLRSSVTNLNTTVNMLNRVISENRDEISELITNSNRLVDSTGEFVEENKKSFSATLKNVNELITVTNKNMQKVSLLLDEIENKQNNVGKVLHDEKLLDDINTTLTQTKELTKILIQQLNDEGIKIDFSLF